MPPDLPSKRPRAAVHVPADHDEPACWLIGQEPRETWQEDTAQLLIAGPLEAAINRLKTQEQGFLVGLLPYPGKSSNPAAPPLQPSAANPSTTPATLMLFDDARPAELQAEQAADDPFSLLSPFAPDWEQPGYTGAAARVLEYLAAGDAYQVNLAQRFRAAYTGDPWSAFRRVQHQHAAPYAAWLDLGQRAVLSFSPESFLELRGTRVTTKPIKGTRPRSKDAAADTRLAADLAAHPKDRAENLMIVDLLRNDLGRVCKPGSVLTPRLFQIESFRSVHHLVSTVEGELAADAGLRELLLACFPGGSITGAPKRRAMEIIDELEPHARDIYCGSLFWMTADGRFGSNILIRSFLAHQGTLYGWAGAGIVMDSAPASEYQECMDKLTGLMTAFAG